MTSAPEKQNDDRDMEHSEFRELTPERDKQGRDGKRALVILGVSLVLAVLCWGIAEIYSGVDPEPTNPMQNADIPDRSAPEPAISAPTQTE